MDRIAAATEFRIWSCAVQYDNRKTHVGIEQYNVATSIEKMNFEFYLILV